MVEATTPLPERRPEPVPSLAELGKKIKSEHEALASSIAGIVHKAISIGKDLNNAKTIVGHGGFLKWVRLNCAMTNKTAERYMKLATNEGKLHAKLREHDQNGEDKFETISNLSLAQAERLITEPNGGGAGSDNVSDRYDNAEKALMKRLSELSFDVAEAAASETIKQLQFVVERIKKDTKAAA